MSILSNAKEIADLVKQLGDIELYRKIVELEGEIIDLTRSNREMEDQIEGLRSQLRKTSEMNFRPPFYFIDYDSTPYCARCWEVDGLQVHLTDTKTMGSPWKCASCHAAYDENP